MLRFGVQKVGNWVGVARIVRNLAKEMDAAKRDSLRRWAAKVEAIAVGHMSAQDLGWARLAPYTLEKKLRAGNSPLILIETSTYMQSITSWVDQDTAYVGVRRGEVGADGELLSNIAKIHEFGRRSGSAPIPARPLWRPSFNEGMAWHMANNTPAKLFLDRILKYA